MSFCATYGFNDIIVFIILLQLISTTFELFIIDVCVSVCHFHKFPLEVVEI